MLSGAPPKEEQQHEHELQGNVGNTNNQGLPDNNNGLIGHLIDILSDILHDFIINCMKEAFGSIWEEKLREVIRQPRTSVGNGSPPLVLDLQSMFMAIVRYWEPVFGNILPRTCRNYAFELKDVRNAWAHQRPFSNDDTYRALDTTERLLRDIGAQEAANHVRENRCTMIFKMATELQQQQQQSSTTTTNNPPLNPTPTPPAAMDTDDSFGWS